MLQKNRKNRLGAGDKDFNAIKNHEFFESINWEELDARKVTPPFNPSVVSWLFVCISICLSVCLFLGLCVCLSVCLYIFQDLLHFSQTWIVLSSISALLKMPAVLQITLLKIFWCAVKCILYLIVFNFTRFRNFTLLKTMFKNPKFSRNFWKLPMTITPEPNILDTWNLCQNVQFWILHCFPLIPQLRPKVDLGPFGNELFIYYYRAVSSVSNCISDIVNFRSQQIVINIHCFLLPFFQSDKMDTKNIDPEFIREAVPQSVGRSLESHMVSASVQEADNAFTGFTYVPPTEALEDWLIANLFQIEYDFLIFQGFFKRCYFCVTFYHIKTILSWIDERKK